MTCNKLLALSPSSAEYCLQIVGLLNRRHLLLTGLRATPRAHTYSHRNLATANVHTELMSQQSQLMEAVKQIVPALEGNRAKGQAGKIGVIGGCREYTGAPYFAAISALKVGADLSHVFCTEGAATVIKSYSPELIVHPYLPDSSDVPRGESSQERVTDAVQQIGHWMDRFDAVVIGPGLGRDTLVHDTVKQVILQLREKRKPMIIDADGLYITTKDLGLLKGYDLAILTPNKNELQRLSDELRIPLEGEGSPENPLKAIAKALDGPLLFRKGAEDTICDGEQTVKNGAAGSKRRAGGQGDVLAGTLAVMVSWARYAAAAESDFGPPKGVSSLLVASFGASVVARLAQARAFRKAGRSMLAGDVIEELGPALDQLLEHEGVVE